MKYLALLRGINVGGNNIIKMVDLKAAFESSGFTEVVTFIQSGNVIFESEEKSSAKVVAKVEEDLSKTFKMDLKVVLRNKSQLKKVVEGIPSKWKNAKDLRCYIAFVREPFTVEKVMEDLEIREGVDEIDAGSGVVYMTTTMKDRTKSKFNKFASKKSYKEVTIRNLNTTEKLLDLMS